MRAEPQRARSIAHITPAVAALCVAALALGTGSAPAAPVAACGATYSYAGVVHDRAASGVRATIRTLVTPLVRWGHVAAWIGVGGPGAGSGGADAWIQVGMTGFEGGLQTMYYEVVQAGGTPRYVEVRSRVAVGEAHRLAVLEMRGRPGWWRVWVDGLAVSAPVLLRGSHQAWQPMAVAESWNGGKAVCNRYRYEFDRLGVATQPGGSWTAFHAGQTFRDPGYTLTRRGSRMLAAGP